MNLLYRNIGYNKLPEKSIGIKSVLKYKNEIYRENIYFLNKMQKCGTCYAKKELIEFGEKSTGIYYKTCIKCREKLNKKCDHGNTERYCQLCNPNIVCVHGYNTRYDCSICNPNIACNHGYMRKYDCPRCNPGRVCVHDIRKYRCPKCNLKCACQNCFYICVRSESRYKPYCFPCFCVLNPHIEIPRRYKTKEFYLQNDLITRFPKIGMIFDKQIAGGCSRKRPDVLIDLITHVIIVEMDEDQHRNYASECEISRIAAIHEDLAFRPLVILRFNPDEYRSEDNTPNPGCFIYPETGPLTCDEEQWNFRFEILCDRIAYHIGNIPDKLLTPEYLFYTGIPSLV